MFWKIKTFDGVSKAKRLDGPRIWTPFAMARTAKQTVAAHLPAK